ncbi:protein CyaE [Thiohalobacter sp. COW1]|nr:protein CyaE [Thiohalobacter sp. COW1]
MDPFRVYLSRPLLGLLLMALVEPAWTGESEVDALPPLPAPLTLQAALAAAHPGHPDLQLAEAERELALAEREAAQAVTGLRASAFAEGRYVEPSPLAPEPGSNDSRASVLLSKRLYDFGRTGSAVAAAAAGHAGRELAYLDATYQQRLEIIARYFDVLLADLAFLVENEAMAIVYVNLDEVRDRHELGQVSDVELLEQETRYQEVRIRRYRAQAEQRTARVRLAEAMGRPGQLAGDLTPPPLDAIERELPELQALQTRVLDSNPAIRAARAEVEAGLEQLEAARAGRRPILTGEVEAAEYAKDFGSRDEWRASVILEVPLLTGGTVKAEVSRARGELAQARAVLARRQLELRQRLVELYEHIRVLQAQRDEAWTRQDYRDLYLDRSRSLYELEVETDLGDAMVESTRARLLAAQVDYQLLLAWAELDALRGQEPMSAQGRAPGEESGE